MEAKEEDPDEELKKEIKEKMDDPDFVPEQVVKGRK